MEVPRLVAWHSIPERAPPLSGLEHRSAVNTDLHIARV